MRLQSDLNIFNDFSNFLARRKSCEKILKGAGKVGFACFKGQTMFLLSGLSVILSLAAMCCCAPCGLGSERLGYGLGTEKQPRCWYHLKSHRPQLIWMDDQEFGFCQVCPSKELGFDADVIRLRISIKCKVHVDFLLVKYQNLAYIQYLGSTSVSKMQQQICAKFECLDILFLNCSCFRNPLMLMLLIYF